MKYLRVEIVNTEAAPEMNITRDERVLFDILNNSINRSSIETFSPDSILDPMSAREYCPTMHEIRNLVIHKADYKRENKLVHALIKLLCCMEEAGLSNIAFNYKKENERW